MSERLAERVKRPLSERGQITIPAEFRDDETDSYLVENDPDEDRLILYPVRDGSE